MNGGFDSLLFLPEQDRRDVFQEAASRLDTLPGYVEKDFWVCLVLGALYNRVPKGHPRLLFKGGTSLSKAFGLIARFSEDIDLVVFRDDLGFEDDRDPTVARQLSNKKRAALFDELRAACSGYIRGDLRVALTKQIDEIVEGCQVGLDEGDVSGQTLFVEYPTLYPSGDVGYVAPRVRIEAGARSALAPSLSCTVSPYVADELPDWSFAVDGIRVIAPERTYWEKLLILHGTYCGYRDAKRLPADKRPDLAPLLRRRDAYRNRPRPGCLVQRRPSGRGSEPQPHRVPTGVEAVRGGHPRIGEIRAPGGTTKGN